MYVRLFRRPKGRYQQRAGIGMNAGQTVHSLYVGSPDGGPFKVADRTALVDDVISRFSGFTISDAQGFFGGRPVATVIVRIATGDTPGVQDLARSIGRKLGQREVGLELKGIYQTISMD